MAKNIWTPHLLSPMTRHRLKKWRKNPLVRFFTYIIIAFIIGIFVGRWTAPVEEITVIEEIEEPDTIIIEKTVSRLWKITGEEAQIIGKYGDNMQWDGENVKSVPGEIEINLDPENDIGKITAEIIGAINPEDRTILDGKIEIEFKDFEETEPYMNGGIANDLILFGDTEKEGKFLPRTKAFVAAWGKATLTLNGQEVYDDLKAVFILSEGTRRYDNKVRDDNDNIYTPKSFTSKKS